MRNVASFPSRAHIDAKRNLTEFIRYCREELTWLADRKGYDWSAPVWPLVRWAKVSVGQRRHFNDAEHLDAEFIDFAKAYFRWKNTERETRRGGALDIQGLKCLEAALLMRTGSGSLQGLSWAVLDEALVVARNHYAEHTRYVVGRALGRIARFVTQKHLVPVDVSKWKSPLASLSSASRTGEVGRAESRRRLPSQAGLDAMAEIFANDPADPQARFISAVWALLMSAPWRISEVLALHVNAEYEETDDNGVISYGLRYYGAKGFEHDIKWIPKVMEPAAREAFRRLREMTEPARAFARHLEERPDVPFLYPDAPQVGVADELTLEEKAAYLRRAAVKTGILYRPAWMFRSIRAHWEQAGTKLPPGFPVFNGQTRLKWSEALFCMHRSSLSETNSTNWYRLFRPTATTIYDLLKPPLLGKRAGVPWKLGYREPDGSPIKLTSHQARHYMSTAAERGSMAQEDLAKWAGRAMLKDNRVYNHLGEQEYAERARKLLEGSELAGRGTTLRTNRPTTPAEWNLHAQGPTHRTEFGTCEHDWVMSPCTKHGDCPNCAEHAYVKGDQAAYARLKARSKQHVAECEKALGAIQAGTNVADRWLEHMLKSLVRELQLVRLLGSDDIEDGTEIRLADDSAEHSHLRRALDQRLPQLRDPSLPNSIKALIGKCINGEALVHAAGGDDRRATGRLAHTHHAHLERTDQTSLQPDADPAGQTNARTGGEHQGRLPNPEDSAA